MMCNGSHRPELESPATPKVKHDSSTNKLIPTDQTVDDLVKEESDRPCKRAECW